VVIVFKCLIAYNTTEIDNLAYLIFVLNDVYYHYNTNKLSNENNQMINNSIA